MGHAATHEDNTISPSQAVFGSTVCLPGQLSLESELDLNTFLIKMKATFSGTKTVNSRFNTATNKIPAAVLPQALLDASHVLVPQARIQNCGGTDPTCPDKTVHG